MPKYRLMPPLERLNELLEVIEIPEEKYGVWSGLIWKVSRGSRQAGSMAGYPRPNQTNPNRADWTIGVDGIQYYTSRVIYYMAYAENPGTFEIDHKDQNWLNNNTWNLRLDIDGDIQKINTPMRRNNTSGVVGVSWFKPSKKWKAEVRVRGLNQYLGLYSCKIEAARVVRDKWIELGCDKVGRELPDLNKVQCNCGFCQQMTRD
jgi:hypothetical protein